MPANGNSLAPAKIIANIYAATGSQQVTADLVGISQRSVSDIITRYPDDLALAKKEVAKQALQFGTALWAHSASKIDSMKGYEAGILGCAVMDKAEKLTAGPAVAIQINGVVADMAELLNRLEREPGQIIEAPDVASDGSAPKP